MFAFIWTSQNLLFLSKKMKPFKYVEQYRKWHGKHLCAYHQDEMSHINTLPVGLSALVLICISMICVCIENEYIEYICFFVTCFFCLFVFNSELCFWDVYLWVGGGKKEISVQIQPIYFRNNCFVVFPWSVDKCSSISLSVCTVRDS